MKYKNKTCTIKFYIGAMSFEIGKNTALGGFHFIFRISFYGKSYYKFKRRMRALRMKRKGVIKAHRV